MFTVAEGLVGSISPEGARVA